MPMMRKNLLSWQWSTYSENHVSSKTILIHRLTVPLFWIAIALSIFAAVTADATPALIAIPFFLVPLVAQGVAHKKLESKKPEPFLSPLDFVSRFFVEQVVTFPRFTFAGSKAQKTSKNH